MTDQLTAARPALAKPLCTLRDDGYLLKNLPARTGDQAEHDALLNLQEQCACFGLSLAEFHTSSDTRLSEMTERMRQQRGD